jgi:PDZ domain-containing protein
VHDPDGEVLFTTVAVGPLTRFERWWLERDEDVDILPEEVVLGTRTRDENAALNQRLMDDSKQIAIIVALERLGEDVDLRGTGAAITQVEPSLPAADVLEAGDTVLEVDGDPTTTADALVSEITERSPGDEIELLVEEIDGDQRTELVALGAREDDPTQALLGVVIETRDPDVTLPFEIDIDTGDVGGPSAGLAMTLAVLDVLTQGELTGGKVVAATGTMTLDGRVGLVGGVRQKTIAARDAGVELFLVPEGELAEARSHAGSMRVEGVTTLDEALGALRDFGGDPLPAVPVDETPAP